MIVDASLRSESVPAEPTPPVDVLVAFENPTGIIHNARSVLALLSAVRLDEDGSMPTGSNMGYWLILQSVTNALRHAELLLRAEGQETA